MIGESWTHRAARPLVRLLLGTWVRPNHLTTLRLLTGLAACAAFAVGSRAGMVWGGVIWVISAFLDRADGELARIGKLATPGGHVYDYYADVAVNTLLFLALGAGLRHSWLGAASLPLGVLSAGSILLASLFAEWLERRSPPGTRAWSGRFGFDPDDALYLFGPLAWLDWLAPILIGAALGGAIMMVLTGLRLWQLRRTRGSPEEQMRAAA